jgi:hypothetical protein
MSVCYNVPTTAETGYTRGHLCISPEDKWKAQQHNSSLLYGEILPRGATKLLRGDHLNAADACQITDLGMVRAHEVPVSTTLKTYSVK